MGKGFEVPSAYRVKIKEAYRRANNGREPSEEEILDRYERFLKRRGRR